MTKKTKDIILLCINGFLILALAFSMFMIVKGNQKLNNANAQIEHKQTAIEKQTEENKQLQEKLQQSEKDKESLAKAKEGLEKENSQLKKTITELKAKREREAAVNKLNNQSNRPAVSQNPQPTGKICYLTFDDGPTANTLKILNILDRYKIKATFFVVDNAQTNIAYVKQIHAAGHTIGLHTASHNYSSIYRSVDNYFADLNAISNKVKALTGVESKVLRFPGGSSNGVSRQYCRGIMTALSHKVTEKGYTYFDWNVDSQDASAKRVSASKITNSVLQSAKNKNSICVLMHDAAAKTTTVDALPAIIEGLINQGFSFQPLTKESHGYHHGINN